MNHSKNISFEYVFHFLFRTSVLLENFPLKEPQRLGVEADKRNVLEHGICFEADKRLFRRDVKRGEPLESWGEHLRQSWLEICQVYADAFGSEEKARQYCQLALQGVALLVLEDGDTLKQHSVTIPVRDKEISELKFSQVFDSEALFKINIARFNKMATCYRLNAMTSVDQPFFENLQLHLDDGQPCLAPLVDSEAAPNAAFLVCGLTFGGAQPSFQEPVESLLVGQRLSDYPSLLSTVFTRLLMGQWQFMRIDWAADNIRALLQERNAYYMDYADKSHEVRPHCARTRLLERQLQEMHSLNTRARFAISRIQGALQTLDINGDNLAKRLEQIRKEAGQAEIKGKLSFYQGNKAQEVHWDLSSHEKIPPLLAFFSLSIGRLQDHSVYIQQQTEYLDALRDKWLLYLDKRKTQMGEYLNTWGTVLIFLLLGGTGAAVTLNVKKGFLGLPFENETIYLILFLISVPILWYFMKWVAKLFCCILYGTWLNRVLCHPILKWMQSVEFFSWFKKR